MCGRSRKQVAARPPRNAFRREWGAVALESSQRSSARPSPSGCSETDCLGTVAGVRFVVRVMPQKRSPSLAIKACADFVRAGYALRFWQTIPSTHPAVQRVIRRILRVARTMGCAQGELHKVELALHEALINAIMHGSGGDPTRKVAVCCLCAEDKGMLLVVRDSGPGFDPSRVPDPTHAENVYETHGRGIFLMRQLMDEVRFEEGGRKVVMSKTGRACRPRRRAP